MKDQSDQQPVTVYYDGECPFCQWEVDTLKKRVPGDQVKLMDINSPAFRLPEDVVDHEDLMARFHVRDQQGELFSGMPAFRLFYRQTGLQWIADLTALPLIRPLVDVVYVLFARVRVPLGRLVNRLRGRV